MSDEQKMLILDKIKDELCSKSYSDISVKSIEKIADILCLDLEEIKG